MSEMIDKKSVGNAVQLKAEAGHPTLATGYPSLEESLERARIRYEENRADYYNTLADEPELVLKTKKWQRSALDYMRWAGALFNVERDNRELRQYALDHMDLITKESGIRYKNMWIHRDLMLEEAKKSIEKQTEIHTDSFDAAEKSEASASPSQSSQKEAYEKTRNRLDKAEDDAGAFYRSAILTHDRFIDLFRKGENYNSWERDLQIAAGIRAAEFREKVLPNDRVYTPGRIIPPHRIPEDQRVPDVPDAYDLYKSQPVDAYEFDFEEEELVLKEGYVSPDGLVDRDSVKYDRKNKKCTIKYKGGEPVTWDYWKATWTGDMPEEGSWTEEYLIRQYEQICEDHELKVLKPRGFETEEIPEYNKKPVGNRQ